MLVSFEEEQLVDVFEQVSDIVDGDAANVRLRATHATLAVCSGQIAPSAGQVLINGREVNGAPSDSLARAGVCLVPEGRGIFARLSVMENLELGAYIRHDNQQILKDVERIFALFPRLKERRKAG